MEATVKCFVEATVKCQRGGGDSATTSSCGNWKYLVIHKSNLIDCGSDSNTKIPIKWHILFFHSRKEWIILPLKEPITKMIHSLRVEW